MEKFLMKKISTIAGLGVATTLALAVQPSARALDFTFSNATAGTASASGTFRITDSAVSRGSLTSADFETWEITLTEPNQGNFTLYGPGGGVSDPLSNFQNSSFYSNSSFPNEASTDGSTLSFTSNWAIFDSTNGSFTNNNGIAESSSRTDDIIYVNGQRFNTTSTALGDFPVANAASAPPTPVPFGVSTDLSILILGGMFGASRLRKTLAARK